MSDTVIRVENLSKKYRISRQAERQQYVSLRDVLSEKFKNLFRNRQKEPGKSNSFEDFWALEDVSFEVKRGEVAGIIGRNGAGKSTLLKILSRITEPTRGRVRLRGRVASLLEVGTGFHPELTGRENIFLNGAILGMHQIEIKRKFDEIVAFAEVEKFLDTPVKRYSSGMYVRLAFAVAAHLEPEILIVDEVLAVGDAQFQKKCLGKMQDVSSKEGRTVLFVSHNMQAVVTLCGTAVWLSSGKLVAVGESRRLVEKYIKTNAADEPDTSVPLAEKTRTGSAAARFTNLTVVPLGSSGGQIEHILTGGSLQLDLEINAVKKIKDVNVAITIYDSNNYRIIDVNTALKGDFLSLSNGEKANIRFVLHELLLKPGRYSIELWLGRGGAEDIDFVRNAGVIDIHENVKNANHTETFPGIYQCRFSHQIFKP